MATKTEHAGAKNGSGYWGKRAEAKRVSKQLRRRKDRAAANAALRDAQASSKEAGEEK